jgi:hypothetical protein
MQTFTIIIHGDELRPADIVAMARQFAGKYEQEFIHKDAGPDRNGVYEETFLDQPLSVVWGEGQPAGAIFTQAEAASGNATGDAMTPAARLSATARNDPDPNTVEIPEDWRDLSGNKLKSIAALLSPDAVITKVQAVAVIEAELARRATRAADAAPVDTPTVNSPEG